MIRGEILSFWVVTKPTEHSMLDDCCFANEPKAIGYQFAGGLKPVDVVGFYFDKETAEGVAKELIANRKVE